MIHELPAGLLGNAIRKQRLQMHLSQEELSELVGITPTRLKHLGSEHRKPSIEVLYKLVLTLNLSLDQLFLPDLTEGSPLQEQLKLLIGRCDEDDLKVIYATARALLDVKKPICDICALAPV